VTALVAAVFACTAWLYLLFGRGGFWRVRPGDATPVPTVADDASAPRVTAIVPARDEADAIGGCVASLLAQDYAPLALIVVDDGSADATVANARLAAEACGSPDRLTLLTASALPAGWTGKLWALQCGVARAARSAQPPEFLLFIDADIVHDADTVSTLVALARRDGLCAASLMPKLRCANFVERAFVPAFVFLFGMLYPFAWVARADRRTAAAAGGCMLVRRSALERAGGIAAVRGALIDDCALARALKAQGPISLALTERVRSVRNYPSLSDVRRMIVRSAYAQLRFSPALLALTVLGLLLTFVVPAALALLGNGAPRLLGALAFAAMALAFQPMLRFYRVSPLWGLALPAIAIAYLLFTLDSAWQAARGRAGLWKGRVYPVRRAR
jgi:hopene-associated glycosyltransferase HpnB